MLPPADPARAPRATQGLTRELGGKAEVHAALACALYDEGKVFRAEDQWRVAVGAEPRFRDAEWVRAGKEGVPWGPRLVGALSRFLELK